MESAGLRAINLRYSPMSFRPLPKTPRPRLLCSSLLGNRTTDELTPPRRRLSLSFHSAASSQPLSCSDPADVQTKNVKYAVEADFLNSSLMAVENGNANSCISSTAGDVTETSTNKLLQVVLVSPQIPGNTGCIARTCAASSVDLHLVGPLGYKIEDSKLKRAGLDYWPYPIIELMMHFASYLIVSDGEKRLLAFTKRGTHVHSDFSYKRGDWLVFGSETSGLPPEALADCSAEGLGGGTIRIPMVETYVRCLNLSVSVGIALYEAARQLNYEQLQHPLSSHESGGRVFLSEDIFG